MAADPNWASLEYTPIHEMQAVHADGSAAWQVPTVPPDYQQAYKLRGVVINNPEDMLDTTPAYAEGPMWNMGGQWQVFLEATSTPDQPEELVDDWGGVCLWMGQNYGNHVWHYPNPSYSYSDSAWTAELERLNYPIDINTGEPVDEPLRVGDLVEIRARGGLAYKGKFNCNEQHDNDPALNFDIVLLERDLVPSVTTLTLADVKDASDEAIFDSTRSSGGEYYQGRLVRLEGVRVHEASQWGVYGEITITDGNGRTLPVHLGMSPDWADSFAPTGPFDLVGVFDQESDSSTDGYLLWALALEDFHLDADLDDDGFVGGNDLDTIRAHWGEHVSTGDLGAGDVSGDGFVGGDDLDLIRANWGFGAPPTPAAVPEPTATAILLGIAGSLLAARRKYRRTE